MKLGVIGGSGLESIDRIEIVKKVNIDTPFGKPSDHFIIGKVGSTEVVFLSRHAEGHTIAPNELNHRANIFGFKKLGVTHLLAFSAVGSLQEHLRPKDIVLIDQLFDRTKKSHEHTFLGDGIVGHIAFSEPICKDFRNMLFPYVKAAVDKIYSNDNTSNKPKAVNGGSYTCMEGPAFSTKAESQFYHKNGFDLVGMTALGESKLAREAGICYSAVCLVTDYDSWHESHDAVTIDIVINTMKMNTKVAKATLELVCEDFYMHKSKCNCLSGLKNAVFTAPDKVNKKRKEELSILFE